MNYSNIARLPQGLVEYRLEGQARHGTILILNGGHTNCYSVFGHEQFLVSQGYQLIIPSRPGYGRTPSSCGKTAEDFADILSVLLDFLHLEQVIVIGISAAGPTALQLAGRHPHRVSKLILQNAVTGGRYVDFKLRFGSYLAFNPLVEGWTWAAFKAFARLAPLTVLRVMMGSLSSLDPAQVVATMTPEQRQAALALLLSLRSGSGFLLDINHHCGELSRITAPTLIITSKYDGSINISHATYAVENIPNSEHFPTPAESHLLWYSSHNKAIENKMLEFLMVPGLVS